MEIFETIVLRSFSFFNHVSIDGESRYYNLVRKHWNTCQFHAKPDNYSYLLYVIIIIVKYEENDYDRTEFSIRASTRSHRCM